MIEFEDFLSHLQGDLEVLRHPVVDLRQRYGEPYEKNAVFILRHLAAFAKRFGDNLCDVLSLYVEYIGRMAEERSLDPETLLIEVCSDSEVESLFQEERFLQTYLYYLTASTAVNRSRYELFTDYRSVLRGHVRKGSTILEIGSGNCLDAMAASEFGHLTAYEKNGLALVWKEILELSERVDLRVAEYRFDELEKYDFVVMIELLEHLSDPLEGLRQARRVLKPDGSAYFTFAVRMPQVDHLYPFLSIEECKSMLATSGFKVIRDRFLVDCLMPFEEEDRAQLAYDNDFSVVYCCLVAKQQPVQDDLSQMILEEFSADLG